MNRIKLLSMAALAATVLASCNKHDEPVTSNEPVAIRLSSGLQVEPLTRAAHERTAANKFNNGEVAYAYVYDATAGSTITDGNGNQLTADGNGNFTQATQMYFPTSGSNVDIYATYPGAYVPGTQITFTVENDQTDLADYLASDLLYAGTKGIAKTSSAIDLTFYHLLTKVRVALLPGYGLNASDISGATVTIENTKLSAEFTPAKATVSSAALAGTLAATASPGTITVASDASTNFENGIIYNDAVIIPQNVASGATFIKVTLANGAELVYNLTAEKDFEGGMVYNYHITVNLTGLTVKGTIADWDPQGSVAGTAQ